MLQFVDEIEWKLISQRFSFIIHPDHTCMKTSNSSKIPYSDELRETLDSYISGEKKLVDLSPAFSGKISSAFYRRCQKPLERLLRIEEINRRYQQYLIEHFSENHNFFNLVLEELRICFELVKEEWDHIPLEGPLVVVSNHPFGGLDGIILGAILSKKRSDFKFLANYLLGSIPEFRSHLIGVDPFGMESAVRKNINPLRETIDWLRRGGCIATFPAGEVSHFRWKARAITDPEWSQNIARIALRTGATIVPIHFSGQNSWLFQGMGMIHPMLRTGLLVRELMNKSGSKIQVCIGKPITERRLQEFSSPQEITQFLRLKTYLLPKKYPKQKKLTLGIYPKKKKSFAEEPLVAPEDDAAIRAEVAGLPAEAVYYEKGKFAVYVAKAHEIPRVLRQIGYLREKTFRTVGEGTGRVLDLDTFDEYYWQMFLWNKEEGEIVGAYRLGEIDEITNRFGKKGLYTRTLFKYDDRFLERLTPGIELGRSFIVPEYQKKHATLSILWKGIGAFIARRPWCTNLFGPVSISQDYQRISRNLMVQFFGSNNVDHELKKMVHPRKALLSYRGLKPLERKAIRESIPNVEEVSALISELELDQKGIPTLLRHYLKLNGKLISFNVDKDFANALDGLILVNIKGADPLLLSRIFCERDLKTFLRYHDDHVSV